MKAVLPWSIAVLFAAACSDNREIPPPCEKLVFDSCENPLLEMQTITEATPVPRGIDALAATGDLLLANDRVIAVIDDLEHPAYLAPTGGTLLDLVARDGFDSLNHLFQATGLLPGDAVSYRSMEVLSGDNFRAVILRGTLDGHPEQTVITRYEIRPCEPGIRIRTEIVNGEPDAAIWTITDAWYWGGRSVLPFTPFPGAGFVHPDFELTSIGDVYRDVPFLAASGHSAPGTNSAYAEIACTDPALSGFHATTISAMGTERRIVEHRDSLVFDRFIGVASGDSVEPAVAIAADVRSRLFGESFVKLRGKVVRARPLGGEIKAQIVLVDSTDTPWTEVVPALDGTYEATVPANRSYRANALAFGRLVTSTSTDVGAIGGGLADLVLPDVGVLDLGVLVDGVASEALVFFHPADNLTADLAKGTLLYNFDDCTPLLGPPHGGSPACNRVLINGRQEIEVPPGTYDVYASAGPFASLARVELRFDGTTTASATLSIVRLPVTPPGTLTGDFHVHGGSSFDSSIPDLDRVRAFLASGIDVIAATDHDVVADYAEAMATLRAEEKLALITGVETTGQILFNFVDSTYIPKVIGHWNFWPVPYRPTGIRRGAPIDDRIEPYELFARVRALGFPSTGVIQLNHPITHADLGRDLGFVNAIEQKLNEPPLPLFSRNAAYDTQEVMNGTNNDSFLTYRAFWHYLLNRGIVRAGTANSDSHGLTDNVLGTPRNVVFTSVQKDSWSVEQFNADVKRGKIVGTNGPMIEVWTRAADGSTRAPSIEAFVPAENAELFVRVRAAAWVPVEEVRIVVNGGVVKTIVAPELFVAPADPFSHTGLLRYEGTIALSSLLPDNNLDAWLIVEAGAPLLSAADLDCDSIPDTGDTNGDGTIDWRDVERDDPIDEAPEPCDEDQDTGPLPLPRTPGRMDRDYHFRAVTPGGYPLAFTNPLLFDRDGGGFGGVE